MKKKRVQFSTRTSEARYRAFMDEAHEIKEDSKVTEQVLRKSRERDSVVERIRLLRGGVKLKKEEEWACGGEKGGKPWKQVRKYLRPAVVVQSSPGGDQKETWTGHGLGMACRQSHVCSTPSHIRPHKCTHQNRLTR